jgi:hypothetical protein
MTLPYARTLLSAACLSLYISIFLTTAVAQTSQAQAQASNHVSAELTRGKLNPATSKAGDELTVRLKEDLKSDGQVVLKKGSEIAGVVRSVKRIEGKTQGKADTALQSMMQIEWITTASLQLNLALQSIAYTSPLYARYENDVAPGAGTDTAVSRPAPGRAGGGGLVGGLTGAVSPALGVGAIGAGATGGATASLGKQTTLATSVAIAPASAQTAASLENNFGVSSKQLFIVGRGQTTSTGGPKASLDILSHMSNDTVIASSSRDFEIGTGAEMQFIVNGSPAK